MSGFFRKFTEGFASFFDTAESRIGKTFNEMEYRIMSAFKRMKKRVFRSVFEIMFWGLTIIFLFAAAILFLSRFFPFDAIFLGCAVLALYIALMLRIIK